MRLAHTIAFASACAGGLILGFYLRKVELSQQAEDAAARASELRLLADSVDRETVDWDIGSGRKERLLQLRVIGASEDAALWDSLATMSDELNLEHLVIKELVDRMGWRAWQQVVAMEPGKLRSYLARRFLAEFAGRDPWKTYAEWKKARGDFDEGDWADHALHIISDAAAGISAERSIEVMKELRRSSDPDETEVTFAAGYDFEMVLDFLKPKADKPPKDFVSAYYSKESKPDHPSIIPEDLLLEWAKRSPVQAVEWWQANPGHTLRPEESAEIYSRIAASGSAASSLAAIGILLPGELDQIWEGIGKRSEGVVNPGHLETATLLGRRESYLVRVLLQAGRRDTVDSSWDQVPLAERNEIRAKAEAEWTRTADRPVDRRARERWWAMLDGAWER